MYIINVIVSLCRWHFWFRLSWFLSFFGLIQLSQHFTFWKNLFWLNYSYDSMMSCLLVSCCRWRWWWFILLIYFAFNSTEIDTHVLFKVYGINLLIHIYFISWWLWENFAFFSFQILYTIFSVMFLADDDDDDNVWYLKVQTKYSQTFIHLLMIQNRFQTLIPERRVRAVALQLNFSQ